MTRLRYNGLTAELGADLDAADTTVTFATPLAHSGGTPVPDVSSPDLFTLSVLNTDGQLVEIVHVTAYNEGEDTATITRGEESTTAADHVAGVTLVNAPTVADF